MKYYNFEENRVIFEELQAKAANALESAGYFKTVNLYNKAENFINGVDGIGYEQTRELLENASDEDDVIDYLRDFYCYDISDKWEELFNEKYTALEVYKMSEAEKEDAFLNILEEAEDYFISDYRNIGFLTSFYPYTSEGQENIKNLLNSKEFDDRYNALLLTDSIQYDEDDVKTSILELLQGSLNWDNYADIGAVLSDPRGYFEPACQFLGI